MNGMLAGSSHGRGLILLVTLLGAAFSSWASYRMHILAIEEFALPILDAVINLHGRAPDQYRVLPYLLIKAIDSLAALLPMNTHGLRVPILVFDTLCLTAAALALRSTFPRAVSQNFVWLLFLIYPFLMFDGYRPISAFILLLCVLCISAIMWMRRSDDANQPWALGTILLLSFTRADIALLYAAVYLGATNAHIALKIVALLTPLIAQFLLTRVLFPEAQYFSAILMLRENLRGAFLLGSPLTYLALALILYYWQAIAAFTKQLFVELPIVAVATAGYVLLLLVIAMPNEYRLFLPLLPIVLWRIEEAAQRSG